MLSRKTTKPKTILQISLPSPVPPFFIYDFDLQHKRQPSSELTLASPPLVEKKTQNNKKHASKRSSRLSLSAFPRFLSLSPRRLLSLSSRECKRKPQQRRQKTRGKSECFFICTPPSLFESLTFFSSFSLLSFSLFSLCPRSLVSSISLLLPPLERVPEVRLAAPVLLLQRSSGSGSSGRSSSGRSSSGSGRSFRDWRRRCFRIRRHSLRLGRIRGLRLRAAAAASQLRPERVEPPRLLDGHFGGRHSRRSCRRRLRGDCCRGRRGGRPLLLLLLLLLSLRRRRRPRHRLPLPTAGEHPSGRRQRRRVRGLRCRERSSGSSRSGSGSPPQLGQERGARSGGSRRRRRGARRAPSQLRQQGRAPLGAPWPLPLLLMLLLRGLLRRGSAELRQQGGPGGRRRGPRDARGDLCGERRRRRRGRRSPRRLFAAAAPRLARRPPLPSPSSCAPSPAHGGEAFRPGLGRR